MLIGEQLRQVVSSLRWHGYLWVCVLAVGLLFGVVGSLEANAWEVRHDSQKRKEVLRRRLRQMLHEQPFSAYALKHLLRLHESHLARLHLLQWYRHRAVRAQAHLSDQAIYARLLLMHQDWEGARKAFEVVLRRRVGWHHAQLGLSQSLVGVGLYKEALAQFLAVLPKIQGDVRETLLLQFLRISLKHQQEEAWRSILKQIRREPWFGEERLTLARTLTKYGAFSDARGLFDHVLKQVQGGRQVRLLLEVSRAALAADLGDVALVYLQKARAIPSLHQWFVREMQMLAVAIYRHRKELPGLVRKLERKWKSSRDLPSLLLLGQLYEEIKQPFRAEKIYLRMLALSPDLAAPRASLLAIYTRLGDLPRQRYHLRQMIKHQVASPKHFLALATQLLDMSTIPRLLRWSQLQRSGNGKSCQFIHHSPRAYEKLVDVFQRYSHRWGRTKTLVQRDSAVDPHCSQKNWDRHRHLRWSRWRQVFGSSRYQAYADEAIQWLKQSATQFPQHWDALLESERLLESFGQYQALPAFHQALEKATENDLEQLSTMRDLLRHRGAKGALGAMLKRMTGRFSRLPGVLQLAEFMLSPDLPTMDVPDATARLRQLALWEAKMCPSIHAFLLPHVRSFLAQESSKIDWLEYRLALLLSRCGGKPQWLKRFLTRSLMNQLLRPSGSVQLASYAIRYRLPGLMRVLIKALPFQKDTALFQLIQTSMPKDVVPSQIAFLAQVLREQHRSNVLARLLAYICKQNRVVCASIRQELNDLSQWILSTPYHQIKALELARQHKLLDAHVKDWLPMLIKRYWEHPEGMNTLAEATQLFGGDIPSQRLHMRCMTRALALRSNPPVRSFHWRTMFYQKANMILYKHRNLKNNKLLHKDLATLEAAMMRFPHLYRGVLAMYIAFYYRFKKHLHDQMYIWIERSRDPLDLVLVKQAHTRFSRDDKIRFFQMILENNQDEPGLRMLAYFAQSNDLLAQHLKVLKKLLVLQPKDTRLLQTYVDLLDRSRRDSQEAHQAALQWLQLQPALTTLATVKKRVSLCCVDHLERLWATRTFAAAMQRYGWAKLLGVWKELRAKLHPAQIKSILTAASSSRRPKGRQQISALATMAFEERVDKLVVHLLSPLLAQRKLSQSERQMLAISLDRMGQLPRADRVWKRFFEHDDAPAPAAFFASLIKQAKLQGDSATVVLGLLRRLRGTTRPDALTSRDRVARLLRDGDTLQAQATWLWLLGKQGGQCLQQEPHPMGTHSKGASFMWKAGLPYFGPIQFFSRCSWGNDSAAANEELAPLAAFLKQHPRLHIKLIGGAGADEPDPAFLAEQRVSFVRATLLGLGIPYHRVHASTTPFEHHCEKTLKGKERKQCRAYAQQVAIVPINSAVFSKDVLDKALSFAAVSKQDSDGDGVIDLHDVCPLSQGGAKSTYPSHRYRRYIGWHRSHSRTRGGNARHPYHRLYPRYHRPVNLGYATRNPRPGCGSRRVSVRLLKQAGEYALVSQSIRFSKRSYYLNRYQREAVAAFSHLLQMAPYLGQLQVEVLAHDKGYGRYADPEKLAAYRIRSLKRAVRKASLPPGALLFLTRAPSEELPPEQQPQLRFRLLQAKKLFPMPRKPAKAGKSPPPATLVPPKLRKKP